MTSHTKTYTNGVLFSNGFPFTSRLSAVQKNLHLFERLGRLFFENISLFERLGHPFVEKHQSFTLKSLTRIGECCVTRHRSALCKSRKILYYTKTRNGIVRGIIMFTTSNSLSKEKIEGTIWQHAKLLEKSKDSKIFTSR